MVSHFIFIAATTFAIAASGTILDAQILPRQDTDSIDSASASSVTKKSTRTVSSSSKTKSKSTYPTVVATSMTSWTVEPYTFTSTFPSSTAAPAKTAATATPTSGGSRANFDGMVLGCAVVGGLVLVA